VNPDSGRAMRVKTQVVEANGFQKKFDFSPPRPRPFLTDLPARIDSYEEGVASFFQWRTGLNYYATIDQIADFVINTKRFKVLDFQTDTSAFALRLAGRKAFGGRIYSFDSNITLLERARQRARHMKCDQNVEFNHFEGGRWPVDDGFAEVAVSFFDFHRHTAEHFLDEAYRILAPGGHLLLAEVFESGSSMGALIWSLRKLQLKYFLKNPIEAQGVYFSREEAIQLFFRAGFRQVIVQGLKQPATTFQGVFSLVAATK
jgi:ubiquinone/menaquinone biosynthesis C-methylase UbiE